MVSKKRMDDPKGGKSETSFLCVVQKNCMSYYICIA